MTLNKRDIILFPTTKEKHYYKNSNSQLKEFIHFINIYDKNKSARFSYIESDSNLLPKLTLKENIYLDSIPTGVSNLAQSDIENILTKTGNGHLIELFSNIRLLDEIPANVDSQTRKLAGLCKALLRDSQYILLEEPEKYLDQDNLELFTKALQYKIISSAQIVLISSTFQDYWKVIANKMVTRCNAKKFKINNIDHRMLKIASQGDQEASGVLQFVNVEKNAS